MSELFKPVANLPPEQQAIKAKCFHPTGEFIEFKKDEVEQSISDRFEKIVRKYPDRLAVKAGDRSLSYAALNQAANRIARVIVARWGQGSEPIALLFEHGIDVIVAIFGTLKAGKFVVALDPFFPRERNTYMLEDSQTVLLLTNNRNVEVARTLTTSACTLLNIDEINELLPADSLNLTRGPGDLYAIRYTSGSTGVPKGVITAHRNVLHSVMLHANEMHTCPDDKLALLHSTSFGASNVNLFQALLNGASLVLFDIKSEGIHRLAKWLWEERITVYHSPPAVFRQLCESFSGEERIASLRLIHLSGAPITQLDFDLYKMNFCPGALLEIGMGSTEARAVCSAFVDESFSFPSEGSPVGYPRPGKTILLLDESGQEVGPGQIGEIAVKGSNLNPGYWRQSGRSEEKFLNSADDQDERIYLTGDLGRMLPDGFLTHLGRKDLMVKIRGYRVEIAEIERALSHYPQVKEAAVLARDADPGEQCLIAYIVARPDRAPAIDELYDFLKGKLPDYMMPSFFVFLESLPLVNGKLDRTALPLPDKQRPNLRTPYVQPHSELQQKLSQMWAEVLSLDRVGAHDNFFDLGGHSLAATRLISRVLDSFRVEVSLKSLFESPTLAGFAQRVEDALHQAHRGRFLPLIPVPRGSSLPASFAQRALWFHDQLEPGSCAYNLVSTYRLSGGLDVKALEQSVNQIIDRHEVLRTVFEAVDGQPVQTILPEMTIELPVMNLSSAASNSVRESEVRRIAGALAGQPFNLAQGPLLRTALLRLARDEYVLLVAIHHIVFDAWSMGIFARELSQLYNSSRTGEPSSLPQLSIQYGDFAVWQRGLQGVNLETLLSYWRNQLGELSTLKLPRGRSKPVLDSRSSAREDFMLSKKLSADLRRLSDRAGTTLFMVLLAAYKIALHRYTGQTDIAIGTPTAGRNHPQVEGLIGFFLNMLVLRTDLSGNPTYRELLERIRKVCVDAFAHQDLPFEKLVEELRPRRDLTHNPLIQVTFGLQNTPRCPLNLTGVTVQDSDISAGVARIFDLHLFMVEEVAGLRGCVSYNTNLFEADTIARLTSHLQNLLEGIVANPDQRISDLPMLTEVEKQQLLVDWNDTKREYPKDKCIHELFEKQVERSPDAVAVVFEDQQLSYRELNLQGNQLAHYLRNLGVGPESLVGICMERSLEMVVGILGIHKAGGAYVPLDPLYPKERLAFMLEDAQPKVLLTQSELLSRLPEMTDDRGPATDEERRHAPCTMRHATVICLDRDRETIEQEGEENPSSEVMADNPAYVIYTSGSTGVPKGVMISHRAICNHMLWMQTALPLSGADRVLQKTPFSFDASVWEFYAPLFAGAQLLMAQREGHQDSAYLVQTIAEQKVTILQLVPSLLRVLLEEEGFGSCNCLRRVFCGGEVLSPELQERFFARIQADLHNLYGPTEACIDATSYACARERDQRTVPIGRPIANTQIYILGVHVKPVPVGIPGELYIGGDGLARGYLNRPDLTAEKFVPNPFSSEPGSRLYRSGDLARYLPDGSIEFLGRVDNQVKIRGFRSELGEIESALRKHGRVREAVVVAREDSEKNGKPADKRLVAYVVPNQGEALTVDELRGFLRQKLPEYMVPSVFVLLERLPLTPNGKVDRKALPAPDQSRPQLEDAFVAPRTRVEETLAGIWAKVLKLERVGIHDDFFELGGHSLLATQVMSRVRGAFQLNVPLRALFEKPTLGELATAIAGQKGVELDSEEFSSTLAELESLSEEETQRLLFEQGNHEGMKGE